MVKEDWIEKSAKKRSSELDDLMDVRSCRANI